MAVHNLIDVVAGIVLAAIFLGLTTVQRGYSYRKTTTPTTAAG
jgi:hypothetical protein